MTPADLWPLAAVTCILGVAGLSLWGNRRGWFVTLWVLCGELFLAWALLNVALAETDISARGQWVAIGVIGAYATKICADVARRVAHWGKRGR